MWVALHLKNLVGSEPSDLYLLYLWVWEVEAQKGSLTNPFTSMLRKFCQTAGVLPSNQPIFLVPYRPYYSSLAQEIQKKTTSRHHWSARELGQNKYIT